MCVCVCVCVCVYVLYIYQPKVMNYIYVKHIPFGKCTVAL